ncbi:MAG: lipoate--protein ligase [Candidatus Adiutrix sp.]|jgi:lipoate-protein ligase A|nr:lipoate--protein ligase [Candidatus Adiutrix sp.]
MRDLVYYESGGAWAPYNLALEEVLADRVGQGAVGCFMLWQNSPAVIIGRHQNAFSEVNLDELAMRDCDLVRRMTGGGAVYHDLGNLNFSFILPLNNRQNPEPDKVLEPLINFIRSLGASVAMEGRNDLSIPGQGKFSGLAGRRLPGGWQLHGTIMYDVDAGVLEKVLRVDPDKYRSKGLPSVRARVTNLKPHIKISLEDLWAGIRDAYGYPFRPIPDNIQKSAHDLAEKKYSQKYWNIGQSPPGDIRLKRRFPFGSLELHLGVKNNQIAAARLSGDFLTLTGPEDQKPIEKLEEALIKLPADQPKSWAQAWLNFDMRNIFYGQVDQTEIQKWLRGD